MEEGKLPQFYLWGLVEGRRTEEPLRGEPNSNCRKEFGTKQKYKCINTFEYILLLPCGGIWVILYHALKGEKRGRGRGRGRERLWALQRESALCLFRSKWQMKKNKCYFKKFSTLWEIILLTKFIYVFPSNSSPQSLKQNFFILSNLFVFFLSISLYLNTTLFVTPLNFRPSIRNQK